MQPQHKISDVCAALAAGSITISLSTIVEVVQLVAGLIAVISGVLSLYFRFFVKQKQKPQKRKR